MHSNMTHLASMLYKNTSTVGSRYKRHHSIHYQYIYAYSYAHVLGAGIGQGVYIVFAPIRVM